MSGCTVTVFDPEPRRCGEPGRLVEAGVPGARYERCPKHDVRPFDQTTQELS